MIHIKRFLVVDCHSLAYRGFHALKTRLTAPDGTPTATIMAFMNMLYKVQDELRPDCTVAVFDAKGKTFRHNLFAEYKAGRPPIADDLRIQLPLLQELLTDCGARVIVREGVEADDVVASVARLAERNGHDAVVLSSDKDLFQILGDHIRMMRPVKHGISEAAIYDTGAFVREYGFNPASMPDYIAMIGDSADNIKGIHGIGEVTAKRIIAQFPTIEAVYASLGQLPKSVRKKLEEAGQQNVLWRRDNLIILRDDLFDNEPDFLADCLNSTMNFTEAEALALRLGLTRVLERIGSKKNPLPREFFRLTPSLTPECDIITRDYKDELRHHPENFAGSQSAVPPRIWDLRTAYYMLHPDETGRRFPSLISAIENSESPQEMLTVLAGNLNAEIDSYDGLHDVMTGLDLPLVPVLIRMEDHGVRLEAGIFESLQEELAQRIGEIESQLIALTGFRVNLNSPQQVSWLLFERLGFKPSGTTKSGASYTTGAGVLEKLASETGGEIPAMILEHRELSKMLSGFVIPLQKSADNDGIIHTTFEPSFTGTGRLSSRDPNLQNIPTFGKWADKIKAGLVPVNPENIFVSADYSQIELRILAHMSGEGRLIEAFADGRDIHTETASWVFGVMPELVTPEMRRAAKMVNFGLLYGMSAFGLSERLGVSRSEARDIMTRYFEALPGIEGFIDELVNGAKERGYSRTLAGRIRPVSGIPAKGAALDRALINSPIQGTAADTARRAMIKFSASGYGELFLQVHDSLVCECGADEAEEVSRVLREVMIEAGGEISHLEADTKRGKSLAEV